MIYDFFRVYFIPDSSSYRSNVARSGGATLVFHRGRSI